MSDAKSIFEGLKRRLDPLGRRERVSASDASQAGTPAAQEDVLLEPGSGHVAAAPDSAPEEPVLQPIAAASAPSADNAVENASSIDAAEETVSQDAAAAFRDGAEVLEAPSGESADDGAAAADPQAQTVVAVGETSAPSRSNLIDEAMGELAAARRLQTPAVLPEAAFDAMAREIESLVAEIDQRTGVKDLAPAISLQAQETAPAAADAAPTLKGGNLLADVRAIAAGWFGNGRKRDAIHAGPQDIVTPEELTAAATERGVEVRYEQKPVNALVEKDFPCIALDKEGGSHILLGRPDKTTFLAQVNGRATEIGRKALEAISSGVVFFIKPKPPTEIERPGTRREATPEKAPEGVLGILRSVALEMFASQRPLLGQLVLATAVSNLFTLALPLFSMAVYDRVVPHLAWETLWALSLGVAIILATDFGLRYIRLKLLDAVGLAVSTSLQARLYSRILHGKMKDAPGASGGVASGFREVEALCHIAPALTVSVLVDIPFFIIASILVYSIGGLVAITPFVGAFALAMVHLIAHFGEDAAKKHSRYVGVQSNVLVETIGSLEAVKITGSERMLLRRWERLIDAASHVSHLNRLQGNFSGQASIVISQAVTVMALVIGVYEISTGAMTVGALTACTLIIGRLMTPVSQIMSLLHRVHQLSSSAQMMHRLLSTEMETAGDSSEIREETPIAGELIFNNVSFTYPGEQSPCLSGITLTIRPGERIGLIGRVGSGKSTLLRLILRMHDATGGTILLDGQDVRQVSPRALRRHFGFMRQDSALFDDTLQANICYGLDAFSPASFERAVAISGVKDFASRHPQGYGMRVGQRGERLSGGERQAVAMARLLTENPPCLMFDEPTAAMDNALEARIVRDLRETLEGKTLIVATHRAPLLALVDRIIWIEGGRVMADGPKADVMRKLTQAA